jgi:uncharacterized protein (DUF1684 family)
MRNLRTCIFLLLIWAQPALAQDYADSIAVYRQHYKQEFLTDDHSPLKAADTGFLRFYAPDAQYKVRASVILTHNAPRFEIQTHSGKTKTYRQYATVSFRLHGKDCTLALYQSMSLIKKEGFRKHLFLPFNDLTNYETTYGGGRYLDLSTDDVSAGFITIDFNKCYNPYCAFAGGYSCPVPPPENRLDVRIEAGEQNFAGTVKE